MVSPPSSLNAVAKCTFRVGRRRIKKKKKDCKYFTFVFSFDQQFDHPGWNYFNKLRNLALVVV